MRTARAFSSKAGLIAAVVLAVDEATKALARTSLQLCTAQLLRDCERVHLTGPVDLVRVANAGSALGFAQGLWVWLLVASLGAAAVPLLARRAMSSWMMAPAAGLLLGGAFGNLLDRIAYGGATDFIRAGHMVFNLADLALVAGAVLATCALYRVLYGADTVSVPAA